MLGDWAALWRCRYFWLSLVKMDLRSRYRRSVLGLGWSLLHPIAMTATLCTVFYTIFNEDVRNYAPFLMAGLVTWNYITNVTLGGCGCFFQAESYIRQYPAPMAAYPLRAMLGGTVHFLLAMSVVLGLAWYCKGFPNPLCLLSLVPTLLLLAVFVWSLAVLAGCANVHFQDTQHLTEVAFQILFYATPIIYKEARLVSSHMAWVVYGNPLVPLMRLIREPILDGTVPTADTFLVAFTVVSLTFLTANVTLARLQRRLIFYL